MILRTRSNTVANEYLPSARRRWRCLLVGRQRQAHRAEDAVHEPGGTVTAEAFRQFHCLVYGRPNGRPIIHKDLPYRKTQDVPVDRADLLHGPLRRCLSDFVIDGIDTTLPLFARLVKEPDIANGLYNIHWLENFLKKPAQSHSLES